MAHNIDTKAQVYGFIRIFIIIGLIHTASASASGNDISELRELLISFDDPKINAQDLAFYLVTHDYDATPEDGHVVLQLEGKNYRLVPNGKGPGLCDILSPI